MAEAEREYVAVRAEMVRLARELWPRLACRMRRCPPTTATLVRGVLDAIAAEHPEADDLLDFCREENARIEAFCAERGPHRPRRRAARDPVDAGLPALVRRARCCRHPGRWIKGQKAFFAITPMPDDWSEEQRESNLREDNDRMLRLLTIHEAVPGHYLQGVYANRCPSIVRAIFASGLFAEGWAVYVTQVMMDVGYGADDPALLLVHWKFYLRSVTNAIIDAKIHCEGMTEDEAVALDGRRRLPGACRGARQVRPGAAVVDPAVDLLRGLDGDVGHRARGPPPGRDRVGRPARRGGRAGAAGRRGLRRDAGLHLPAAPRIGHRPRLAADVAAAADPAGLGSGSGQVAPVRFGAFLAAGGLAAGDAASAARIRSTR